MDHQPRTLLLLFLGSFLLFVMGCFWGLPSGKSVAGALVILDGGVPYRDFWTMYAPGQFYAVALLYAILGSELLVQAVAACVVRAASAVAFLVLLRRLGATNGQAASLSVVFVLMFWTTSPELTDYPLALPFLLLALNRVVRYFASSGITHLRWAGVWLGVGACFKHDISAYVAIGVTVSLFLSWLMLRGRTPSGWAPPLRATLAIAATALAVVIPAALWIAWNAARAAWNDLFVFPATVFSKVRGDLFPPLIPEVGLVSTWLAEVTHVRNALRAAESLEPWVTLYAPQVVFLTGLGVLWFARRQLGAASLAHLTLLLACMPFFWAAARVQHNTHPYTLAILGAGVGVVVWSWLGGHPEWRSRLRRPVIAGVAIYAMGLMTTAGVKAAAVYYQWPNSRVLELSGLRGVRVPTRLYESFQPVGKFFRNHVPEGEPIYTGLLRHDSIVINNALLYAIAGRPACCGYTELHPGVGDRAPVHLEIIRRLEEKRVRALALWAFGWSEEVMEARKRHTMAGVPDAGSTILDRYIADHFELVSSHGEYHVLWRRDAARPVPEAAGNLVPE
ncbi:MAG: hypothetical protein ACT4QD_12250 [Acidobacteriota bacterium]